MSRFDRFMVHVDIGTDEKLARLTDAERLCHIAGVLAIAAKSPIRGRLLVGEHQAGPVEVARRAGVSTRVAKSTIDKLAAVGILVHDDEYECWRVYHWERFNPEPRNDPTNAERQARHKAKKKAGNATGNGEVTLPVTPPEVEEEEQQVVGSPVVGGHATANSRTQPLSIGDERQALAEHVRGILQRGIDGLTTNEKCKPPSRAAILAVLADTPWERAEAAAVDARSVAQSQNRAPNIVALFAQRLSSKEAAA